MRRGRDTAPYREDGHGRKGFTLVELLVVIGVIALLGALVLPAIARSVSVGRRGACVSNLRVLQTAYLLYLGDHDGLFFPYVEDATGGDKLYYFGLSSRRGAEGERPLDMSKARLAPYLGNGGGVEICPEMPYRAPYFKQKYKVASYGYGINIYLLSDLAAMRLSPVKAWGGITKPSETIAWGDAAQINTFQPPASPTRPMLEEWYYLDNVNPQKYHFRHDRRVNVVFCDGSVKSLPPAEKGLDPRCDGLVGALEPNGDDDYLRTSK